MEDDEPSPLEPIALARSRRERIDHELDFSLSGLCSYLSSVGPNDRLKTLLAVSLARWDASTDPTWTVSTPVHTASRRNLIYGLMELDHETTLVFDAEFPVADAGSDIISTDDFIPWYSEERRAEHAFYWPAYKKVLSEKGWEARNLATLDTATTRVVERLSDPTRTEPFAAKGLVVGYVQSGKTANFTGVLAKAIDSGYRLIIVLTGTIDLLRKQTQRRLDMELVGLENIFLGIDPEDLELAKAVDYFQDPDRIAGKFMSHGFQPSDQGFPDIVRLTRHNSDYRSLNAGITALELAKTNKRQPLYNPDNLFNSDARLAVVKKNASVLRRLVRDLKTIKSQLSQIPTLIIDDESDQASVNTSDPAKWKENEVSRTAINGLISQLLELLPRAQYVGYTATPYANVFVDPNDSENIFPKDFLLSLDRPEGYMGVGDFHDLDLQPDEDRTYENSNELALVRNLYSTDSKAEEKELLGALDAFVLSGAIKLFRETTDSSFKFKHHTMLIHETVRTSEHKELSERVRRIWRAARYQDPSSLKRLEDLLLNDFAPVMNARAPKTTHPRTIEELRPYIGAALDRIMSNEMNPVLIVNGDVDVQQQDLDFDLRPVWRILIGGTKLSRGFTVEGLTISYYRRKTGQADTLMQMGRWFGFRPGYADLVRLFIGRNEAQGRAVVDLYKSFEAVVRDEESFRAQLKRYATLVDGAPQCRPRDVPPLVSQRLPTLKPSARNKMFNAELVVRRSPGEPLEPLAYPRRNKDATNNYQLMSVLLDSADQERWFEFPPTLRRNGEVHRGGKYRALTGSYGADDFLDILTRLTWMKRDYFAADLTYFNEITSDGSVESWVVLNPQLRGGRSVLPGVSIPRTIFNRPRPRTANGQYGAISDPRHRPAAARIAQARISYGDAEADALSAPRRGAVILYPNNDSGDVSLKPSGDEIDILMTLYAPAGAQGNSSKIVQFRVRDSANPTAAIVDSSPDGACRP